MSDTHAPETHEQLFDKSELDQFVSDDQTVGRNICKMLAALFIYTLVAMSIAAIWTHSATR